MRTIRFHTTNIAIDVYRIYIQNGSYDIDPIFQRNNVVEHKTSWKSRVIAHLIKFNSIPPFFYHKKGYKYENLDGKQRTCSILSFINNEFELNSKKYNLPDEYNGKFSEWSDDIKTSFNNIELNICKCEFELTQSEISNFFEDLQNSNMTTKGERLNADTSNIFTNRIKNDDFDGIVNDIWFDDNRHKRITELFRLFYIYEHRNNDIINIPPQYADNIAKKYKIGPPDNLYNEFRDSVITSFNIMKRNNVLYSKIRVKNIFEGFFMFYLKAKVDDLNKLVHKLTLDVKIVTSYPQASTISQKVYEQFKTLSNA